MNEIQRMLQDIAMEVRLTRRETGIDAFDERVMAAMKKVPRHEFVPTELRYRAYDNSPLPIGLGQTISQPYIVALMSHLLHSKAGDSVLEIGTGSGYQTAVLACLVERVYSVEIVLPLTDRARVLLAKLGYGNVELTTADGYHGWLEHAPYDGIIVTAAAPEIPEPLIRQLKAGARLVIPVGLPYSYQELVVVEKSRDGAIERKPVLGVSFVPLTGEHGGAGADRFYS